MSHRGQIGLHRGHGELTIRPEALRFAANPAETLGAEKPPDRDRVKGSVGPLRIVHGVFSGRLLEWNEARQRWDHLFGGFGWWRIRADLADAGWESDEVSNLRWRRRRSPPAASSTGRAP